MPIQSPLLLDSVEPINWLHPTNRGLTDDWTIISGLAGGTRLVNLVHGENNGLLTNGAVYDSTINRFGGDGTILYDGTDSYTDCGASNVGLTGQTVFFVSAWVNTNTTTNSAGGGGLRYIVTTESGSNGFMLRYSPAGSSNQFQFYIGIGSGFTGPVTFSAPAANIWYHLIAGYDTVANLIYLYVNGKLQSSMAASADSVTGANLYIGTFAGQTSRAWSGWIDGVQCFNVNHGADGWAELYRETAAGNPNRYNWLRSSRVLNTVAAPATNRRRRVLIGASR